MAGGGRTIEYTPTWVVAAVCSVIVTISIAVERLLHYLGKLLKKKNQKPLYQALQKIKEELMLLGFISLLLTVFQGVISRICISKDLAKTWLPCTEEYEKNPPKDVHLQDLLNSTFRRIRHGTGRHLLAASYNNPNYCKKLGKVPLLSETALHHLHIFIFVLAVSHVTFCALTVLFGGAKIRQWKKWEEAASQEHCDLDKEAIKTKFTHVLAHSFVRKRYRGVGKKHELVGWLQSFGKQFFGSVNETDYTTLRLGFIMSHCRSNPKFNFYNYLTRAYEADFKKVVGISWYLWLFVVVFLLANVHDLHAYFWISFIPFIMLLCVGTKLQHIMTQLAQDVAQRHIAVEGDLVVKPSDDHFWCNRPKLVLLLIHIILFQNSFELAVVFWILVQYGSHSCIMGSTEFIIPRLVMGMFVQFLCSYSILPLYAVVAQMGSSFKKAIFKEHIQEGLILWAKMAKKNADKKPPSPSTNLIGTDGDKSSQDESTK
ncbi:MLO-like protein [Melia azedarach]|uniref:MLO-like protein n=1 Tax=Melia azedarach TaxID=155640 RepID=A0ACC1YJF6_MELAZ|nr:MLO-like protein [Melia azedarach]